MYCTNDTLSLCWPLKPTFIFFVKLICEKSLPVVVRRQVVKMHTRSPYQQGPNFRLGCSRDPFQLMTVLLLLNWRDVWLLFETESSG